MAKKELTIEQCAMEMRRLDRYRSVMATRLLNALGVPAQLSFEVNSAAGTLGRGRYARPFGEVCYKDVFDAGDSEKTQLQILVMDENGWIKAESKALYSPGEALDILAKLPLPLSPRAESWLKDCMGEDPQLGNLALAVAEASRN